MTELYIMTKIMKFIHFFILIVFSAYTAFGNIIRDSEIEETLFNIAKPIAASANIKDLKIYLIQDDSLNAFTDGGDRIYLFSGMLTQFNNIDVIRGVIAHEIGHILGKHVVRRQENIETYNKIALSSAAIGLVAAVASNASMDAATAIIMGSDHFANRSIMSYSRAYESSADQAAIRLLEKNGYSVQGMMDFFAYISKQSSGIFINQYDQTHPLSQDRMTTVTNHYQKSKFKTSNRSADLEYRFERSVAKLLAFTTKDPKKLLHDSSSSFSEEITDYIRAICFFRIGDLNNAIKMIDKLITKKPLDAFFHELKGQILFEFGKKESLDSYNTAVKLKPNDLLIKLSRAIVGITVYFNDTNELKKFYTDLQFVQDLEPDNMVALYYISLYYDRVHEKPKSLLYSAIMALKTGNFDRAKILARQALPGLKKESPDWYKANDIIIYNQPAAQ